MKIKNSHTSKDMIKKVKTQSKEREKIFDNHVFDKDLACRIHNEFLQLNNVKDKHPIRKWEKGFEYFSGEDIQVASMHIQRCSTSLVIKEMQIKAMMRYYLSPTRMNIK